MQVFEKHGTLVVKAPAKLNLFLEVIARRPDGYHEIETVMQTISIYDELTFRSTPGEVRLVTDSPDVPHDRENLVVKAAEALRKHSGVRTGTTIRLVKNIPVGSGMGGGSSDAAATLVGLNRLWELDLSREVLHGLASELGSDVPFFLYGGTALCRGRGERVAQLMHVRPFTYVVCCPPIRASTREVYEKLPDGLTKQLQDIKLLLAEITSTRKGEAFPRLFNRLESVTVGLHESLKTLPPRMTEQGLESVTMTGSGSAFFGIARGRKEASAIVEQLSRMGLGKLFVAESIDTP